MQASVETGPAGPPPGQPVWLAALRGLGGAVMFVLGLAAALSGSADWFVAGVLLGVAGVWAMVSGIGS